MAIKIDEKQVDKLVKALGITEEEAVDIIQSDYAIDHGERVYFDLSKEEEKKANQWAKVKEHTITVKDNKQGKTKKPNEQKELIISTLAEFLKENNEILLENVEILNKNRLIHFKMGAKEYDLTLIEKRKPK